MGSVARTKWEFLEATIDGFWARVDRRTQDECWPWRGQTDNGYGRFTYFDKKQTQYAAHRFAWMISNGRIPAGFVVMHTCDDPKCVNPLHLRASTQADNIADRDRKGRAAVGSDQGSSKLNEGEVREILGSTASDETLGEIYGVHRSTISKIKKGENWKHVQVEGL